MLALLVKIHADFITFGDKKYPLKSMGLQIETKMMLTAEDFISKHLGGAWVSTRTLSGALPPSAL